MDIEKLTKAQIVLLTLFVSFVTSIATGIVTVTLLDQAPPGITHTVSKVVQTTVEKVVEPGEETEVRTVVVDYEDTLANTAGVLEQSIVRIYIPAEAQEGTTTPETSRSFTALGFIFDQQGRVIADAGRIIANQPYEIELSDGNMYVAEAVRQDEDRGLALLSPQEELETNTKAVTFTGIESVRLGQTIFALAGENQFRLVDAIISEFISDEGESTPVGISAPFPISSSGSGAPAFTAGGKVVGMILSREGAVTVIGSDTISDFVSKQEEEEEGNATSTNAATSNELSVNQ